MPEINAGNVERWSSRLAPLLRIIQDAEPSHSYVIFTHGITRGSFGRLWTQFMSVFRRYDVPLPPDLNWRKIVEAAACHTIRNADGWVEWKPTGKCYITHRFAITYDHGTSSVSNKTVIAITDGWTAYQERPPHLPMPENRLAEPEALPLSLSTGLPTRQSSLFPRTLSFDPELFHAVCVIKNRDLVTTPIVMTGITVDTLPPWSHYQNLMITNNEDEENSIIVL